MDHFGVTSALLDYASINRRVAWWDPSGWASGLSRARHPRVRAPAAGRARSHCRYEIPASFTFTADEGSATMPLATPPAGSPVPLCEWQLRLGDLYFDLDHGRDQRALAAYRRLSPARQAVSHPNARQPPAPGSARSIGPPAEPSRRSRSSIAVWPSCLTTPRC